MRVINFSESVQQVVGLYGRLADLSPEEKRDASRLCTALVRILLDTFGWFPRVMAPEAMESAREFVQQYGQYSALRPLLHLALVLDRDNSMAYTYLVKVMRDFPTLWWREADNWEMLAWHVGEWAGHECYRLGETRAQQQIVRMAWKEKITTHIAAPPIDERGRVPAGLPDIPLSEILPAEVYKKLR